MKLHVFDALPHGFFEADVAHMHTVFPGPSLVHLAGEADPPLFVSTLLHGNETTGTLAVQKLLKHYLAQQKKLPRSLNLFFGNIAAARENVRHLKGQPDYNRIWNGGETPEHALADQVVDTVTRDGIFATVDVHNSSGKNPHYACINRLENPYVNLGRRFSRTLVYFTRPAEVLSCRFAPYGPSISIESGLPGEPQGVQHVAQFLEECLRGESIPGEAIENPDCDLYHSTVCIRVPRRSTVGFENNGSNLDFCFIENLDLINFSELPENALLGWRLNPERELLVFDEHGNNVADDYLEYSRGEIRLKRTVIPSLFTTNVRIIYQDCLGYLMERYPHPSLASG